LRALVAGAAMAAAGGCGNNPLPATCGTGTHLDNHACVVDVVCGPGTTMVGNICLSQGTDAGVSCGPGTRLVGSECVAADDGGASGDGGGGTVCGPGTAPVEGVCLPLPVDSGTTVTCGAGTHLQGNQCVTNPVDAGATVTCGAGTHLDGGACVTDPVDAGATVTCGAGTHLAGDICVPNPDGGGPQFVVRVGVTTLGADGFSSIPVVIYGTDANGDPSTDTIVLDTSRAGAGTVSPTTIKLTPTGATAYFTPCNAAASMWCPGPVHITLALASAPNVVLAESQEITLLAPTGIGSDAPCLAGGNVIFFNGDAADYIFSGTETITRGQWSAQSTSTQVHVNVWPTDQSQGLWWDLYFDSSQLGTALTTQVYQNAERWPFEAPGHPGLDVSGDGRGCNTVTGSFQIEDLTVTTGGSLTSFTATFEHHCEGGSAAVRGCVHYGM
jgi:hypothetical protein